MRVLVAHTYEPPRLEQLRAAFPDIDFVHLPPAAPWPEGIEGAEAYLFAGLRKRELNELLVAAGRVSWIHTGSAGFDWVMVPEVERRGIVVTRSMDVMSIPIAEFVLAAMLHHAKRVPALMDAQARRSWEPPMHLELRGKTVLVVGVGSIGRRVAGLCKAFGMEVLGIKRDAAPHENVDEMHPPASLADLLPRAHFVVLCTPSTPETDGMIGAAELRAMRPDGYLINVARGSLLDDDALVAALKAGEIAGACLDAYDEEPLPADSPLWCAPNLFASPHASYRTPEIRDRVIEEFSANLRRRLAGEELVGTMRHAHLGY